MSRIFSYYYDKIMAATEEACLKRWRIELIEKTHGRVIEIGSGTGANIHYYPDQVTHLTLSEPDKHMRRQLENKVSHLEDNKMTVSAGSAEAIDADCNSADFVISTLVCCSVKDLQLTLSEIKRVLKPGGSFIFLEHVAAEEGTKRHIWQHRINPFWKRLAGNCHLIRDTESEIISAGFEITDIKKESMRKAPPIVRPTIRGTAIKPLQ